MEVEYRFKSSPGAIKDFISGTVWADMKTELNGAIDQMHKGLEGAKDFESVLRLQECIETIKRILMMPEVILGDIEEYNNN